MEDRIGEQIVEFGDGEPLVAIATAPSLRGPGPGVLILNAGVLHRVGPHRLHVRLARELAAAGFAAVRMDLSGIGDSRAVPGNLSFRASAVADARRAMDHLAAGGGPTRYVLFGVCSGADNALATAVADPRVIGLVLVDPAAYASRAARMRQILARIRRIGVIGALRHVLVKVRRGRARGAAVAQSSRTAPPAAQFERDLTQLVARGVRMLMVYSGVLGTRYNHPDQLFESFPALRGRVDVAYFPGANHTFTELAAQQSLRARVLEWCGAQFVPVTPVADRG